MKISKSSVAFTSLALLVLAGCPVTGDDLCAKGTCEAAIDANSPDAADAGPDGLVVEPRDPCIDKPTAPECVTNEHAIFVSKAADPNGADGTIAKPYPSLATALAKVTAEKKRVYVCEGTYEEQVTIEKVPTTLIGSLGCDFRSPGPKPKIAPKSGIAFGIAAVGGASVIDVAIEAVSDVNAPGSSAIGMFITGSAEILLRGVEITTGPGQPGTDGKNGIDTPNHPNQPAPTGVTGGGGGSGGIANTCTACADGTSSKAGDGASRLPAVVLATSGDATPKVSTQKGNGGGSAGTSCTDGDRGAHGEPATKPAAGGSAPGKLAATSWTDRTTTAENGKNGNPGQGGGGGGARSDQGGGGGSGACGGCGGTAGTAGSDGGSSIGVLVYNSPKVVIENSKITTGIGGKGGNGGDGQPGQEAPPGGAFGGGGGACSGGGGGHGAGGGGGGGGVGGYSIAIAYLGDAPTTQQSTLLPAAAGEPGTGGLGGAAVPGGGQKGEDGANGNPSKSAALVSLE